MKGLLKPTYKEHITGQAEIRKVIVASKIAGCMVTNGVIKRDSLCRLMRDGVVIYEGKLNSLKRFQNDAKEVAENYECGLTIENFNDIKEGDIVEGYEMVEEKK